MKEEKKTSYAKILRSVFAPQISWGHLLWSKELKGFLFTHGAICKKSFTSIPIAKRDIYNFYGVNISFGKHGLELIGVYFVLFLSFMLLEDNYFPNSKRKIIK